MITSLIDRTQMKKDPRKLAFMYPKMPVGRYKELTEEYHRKLTIIAVEQVAGMFDAILLPARCVHHSRRNADRRLMIHGKTFYIFEKDQVTELEWAKYRSMCEDVEQD